MFTQDSRKLKLALSAIFVLLALYIIIITVFLSMSSWAERDLGAYPFKQEDWLRYLLPSKFSNQDRNRILLTGPSTVRENLLYEKFEAAFPEYTIFQGGISLGTMDDVTASLIYTNKVYGEGALPKIILLGISPRFISNIPEHRPFINGINKYSPYYSIKLNDADIEFIEKNVTQSIESRYKFFMKANADRFRTALYSIASLLITNKGGRFISVRESQLKTPLQKNIDELFKNSIFAQLIGITQFRHALNYNFSEVLSWLASPYKYSLDSPADTKGLSRWMNAPKSWWHKVHNWNPIQTREKTISSIKQFTRFIKEHKIRLVVVNMPERDISRRNYNNKNYSAYINIVKTSFGPNVPFLDLRLYLESEEFHDLEHSIVPGSIRLTDEVIMNLKKIIPQ